MKEITELRKALRKYGRRNWRILSAQTGIAELTIKKIAYSDIKIPGADKYLLLTRALREVDE